MSEKHLGKGSTVPPYAGILRLYNMRFCPYAQRAVLVLNAKNVPYDIVNVNLMEKPEWIKSKSPWAKVPSLEIKENVTIHESLVVSDYLEDAYPEPKLVADDPYRKAQDKLIVEGFNRIITLFYTLIRSKNNVEESTAAIAKISHQLDKLQNQLVIRNTKFFYSDEYPGMVDYMIWPWFERFDLKPNSRFAIDKTKFQLLIKWMEDMKQEPAVKNYLLKPEVHELFLESFLNGNPDYELLSKNKL